MYENATLKVQIQQLTQNIEKLKSHMQRPKKINVDAKIIEKLATQSSSTRYIVCKREREREKEIISNIFIVASYIFNIKSNLYLTLLTQNITYYYSKYNYHIYYI